MMPPPSQSINISQFSFLLSDLKLHLQSTDYGNFLANVPSPLQVSVIDDKLREKFVTEFQHMRNHSTGALATFLDFITYRYMGAQALCVKFRLYSKGWSINLSSSPHA